MVELGVFEQLSDNAARSAESIAREIGADPAMLYRLLRALSSIGLLWGVMADFRPWRAGGYWGRTVRDELDISAIRDAGAMTREGGYWRIAMPATWSDLTVHRDCPARFDAA